MKMQETIELFDDIGFTHNGYQRWADVQVSVDWLPVDNSFDHAFGREIVWDLEWEDYTILHFTVYDEDGEVMGDFNLDDYETYDHDVLKGLSVVWKTYSKYLLDIVPHLIDELEQPEREYD